jgi:RHS repeat-associated protein
VCFSQSSSTGKERDTESGNDYFGARYYSSAMGRFLSPDWSAKAEPVPYAKLDNPQTLNLYGYMRNNPLGGVDQDGHCDWCQKLWNGITGNGFQTNAQIAANQATVTATMSDTYALAPTSQTTTAESQEPNGAIALGADAANLASATPGVIPEIAGAIPGAPAFGLGLSATGVSVSNDPSTLNLSINATSTTFAAMSTFGTGAVAAVGTVGGYGVAAGALALDGSNFVVNQVLAPMFKAAPSATINADGVTTPNPALMNEGDLANGR